MLILIFGAPQKIETKKQISLVKQESAQKIFIDCVEIGTQIKIFYEQAKQLTVRS